ncbi:phage tail fiber protein [Proteus terrae]|uniref:phage tail fiber protein n=1 Tax=Proteus terrae TaxID=1574161 RepID=UPI00301BD55C
MNDISATGLSLIIQASNTFPAGIPITTFSDEGDPLDLPAVDITATAVDINGNLVSWSAPTPQTVTINVLAGSEEDENLAILLDANTARRGRRHASDIITLVASYGDGSITTARNGRITNGSRGHSISNNARLKSKQYTFIFQDFDRVRAR